MEKIPDLPKESRYALYAVIDTKKGQVAQSWKGEAVATRVTNDIVRLQQAGEGDRAHVLHDMAVAGRRNTPYERALNATAPSIWREVSEYQQQAMVVSGRELRQRAQPGAWPPDRIAESHDRIYGPLVAAALDAARQRTADPLVHGRFLDQVFDRVAQEFDAGRTVQLSQVLDTGRPHAMTERAQSVSGRAPAEPTQRSKTAQLER